MSDKSSTSLSEISQGIEESVDEQASRFAMIDSERNVESESNITFFLGLKINIKYNKCGIINEILIKILALMRVFFCPLDLLKSNGLKNV